jgi:hypothetical protein
MAEYQDYKPRQVVSIQGVEYSDFKGNKIMSIPVGSQNEKFSFGKGKARAILKYIKEIERFAEDGNQAKL